MTLSKDADILWQTALELARRSAEVSPRLRKLPPLLFFTDPERTPTPWRTVPHLPAGAAVVYRAFSRPDAREIGLRLRAECNLADVRLLVGKDEALARDIAADGVHLPETDLSRGAALREAHPSWIITGALHAPLGKRALTGLDAVVVSPVFPAGGASASKPDLGLWKASQLIDSLPCPAYALGGITAVNARQLLDIQACGIAGVDAIRNAFGG
ncbi:thiamine phosphate synthase [uncultured Brevundimonas sp.]|uniref:thiamine phosphate synthase n=1 Tax=uncultured Brevundimonas sp. TaxID=213418 RepID=UPI002611D638|nr:thiamine phosphate synthase [uncultured Brevundimonas sp.]